MKIGDWRRLAISIVRPKSVQADRAVGIPVKRNFRSARVAEGFSDPSIANALPLAATYMTMPKPRHDGLGIVWWNWLNGFLRTK